MIHRWLEHKNADKKTLQVFESECAGVDEDGVQHFTGRGQWIAVLSIHGNGHVELHGEIVPPYPDFGSMGGGSAMETRAQKEWESKYGQP